MKGVSGRMSLSKPGMDGVHAGNFYREAVELVSPLVDRNTVNLHNGLPGSPALIGNRSRQAWQKPATHATLLTRLPVQ